MSSTMSKLKFFKALKSRINGLPPGTYGGKDTMKALDKEIIKHSIDKRVNVRGAGVRFVKIHGRIVPIRGKK